MFITRDNNHIIVPWRADVPQLIPHARAFEHAGARMLLVPNQPEEAKVLRNVGVPVPPPLLTRYDWHGKTPWEVQKTTAALLTESKRAYVLSTMGTGKTRAAIWAADYLRREGMVKRILISAPLSTLSVVWEAELFQVLPRARVRVLHGGKAARLKLLAEDADWYIVNHHGLRVIQDELLMRAFDLVILDELAVFRNKGTELWKAANTVVAAAHTKYAWGLTGSPTPTAPTDAWAQIKMLTPDQTTRSIRKFRDMTMRQITNFKWMVRPEANDIVHTAMQPSVRYTRDDVQELPPTTYVTRAVKPEPLAAKAYKLLFDKMALQTKNGETITAVNEGVLQMKLMQVACGYVYTDKHGVLNLPNQSRLDALLELVQETDRKVIVFVPFVHALEGVNNFLVKNKIASTLVYGATSLKQRDKTFRAFQNDEEPRVLVAHPQCMAHGLSLTAANTIIWYCLINSNEIYEQANARITRPGQTSKTLIAHIIGTPVEKVTYYRLKERAKMQGVLLDLFKHQELEF